ncbi:Pao retrotransposon peptidase family protein [Apostichopus japonicus]|uniref:Pao retrotransposon peptidase family protein n=1 Tax=Stichopus japonicus TaxID=307972 RepID=A0A2G8JS35_STIJA|nr:Pao retrotransposon peptidase family protein [Apostichopus japonicus]
MAIYKCTVSPEFLLELSLHPTCWGATINFHLDKNPGDVSNQIKNNVYVDNVIIGSNSVQEAVKLYQEAKQLFDNASMNLREWLSNSKEFNQMLPEKDRAKGTEVSVLGMLWDIQVDTIKTKLIVDDLEKTTKRSTLQQLAKIFDPLGFLSPITIRGKILHQEMWKEKFDWDDPLPEDYVVKWKALQRELVGAKKFSIPRWILSGEMIPVQLICFTDASLEAYSACVYVRQKELPAYVQRRTQEIVGKGDITFNYVDTKENPADLATRGISAKSLKESNWLTGPKWTIREEIYWPKWSPGQKEPNLPLVLNKGNKEKEKSYLRQEAHLMSTCGEVSTPFGIDVSRYGNIGKLMRVTAYCHRFINLCLKRDIPDTKAVTVKELQYVRNQWIQVVQQQGFNEEINLLKKGGRNQLIKQLDLFLDGDVIRCGGRLANANLTEESQYPTLLPRDNKFTTLVINKAHDKGFPCWSKIHLGRSKIEILDSSWTY